MIPPTGVWFRIPEVSIKIDASGWSDFLIDGFLPSVLGLDGLLSNLAMQSRRFGGFDERDGFHHAPPWNSSLATTSATARADLSAKPFKSPQFEMASSSDSGSNDEMSRTRLFRSKK